MRNATEIVMLIDASASMSHLQDTTIKSVNQFIDEQRSAPGDANIRLVQFNAVSKVMSDGSLNWITPINVGSYRPSGTTALADAVCMEIDLLGKKLASMKESDRPDKVVFVIITDGQENSSVGFDMEQASERIKHQQSKYNWKFLYLAAGVDAFHQGKDLGLTRDKIVAYNSNIQSSQAMYGTLSTSIRNYRSGVATNLSVSDDERSKILSK